MLFAVFAMLCSTVAAILQADAANQGGRTSAVLARPRFLGGIAMDIVTWLCMTVALPDAPAPPASGLAVARETVTRLAGPDVVAGWGDDTALTLAATGREPGMTPVLGW